MHFWTECLFGRLFSVSKQFSHARIWFAYDLVNKQNFRSEGEENFFKKIVLFEHVEMWG